MNKTPFYRTLRSIPVLALATALVACASTYTDGYVPQYESAVSSIHGADMKQVEDAEIWEMFEPMRAVFSDLKSPDLEDRIRDAYADQVYFNDTFHTFTTQDQLVDYLVETADRVVATTTEFEEVGVSGSSYFLRWKMHIEVEVSGETIVTDSIGVSQLRFDDKGKVVFHQDFWDNTEGFFRHLPVVGYVLDKTFQRL